MAVPECPRARLGVALDRPEPGFFAVRLGRRMPWTPAMIYRPCPFVEQDEMDWPYHPEWWCEPLDRAPNPLRAVVGDREVEGAEMVLHVWQSGRGIPRHEYDFLVARREYARRYAPDSYHAQPIDLRVLRKREIL